MTDEATRTMPDQPKTVEIRAMTDRALLEDLARTVTNVANNVGEMRQDVTTLMADRPVLHSRLAGVEGRIARLESPSMQPPAPLTSEHVRAVIDEHPSRMDLETAARQAEEIVKNQERDRRIAETLELATQAATKDDVAKIAQTTATKDDVAELRASLDSTKTDLTNLAATTATKDEVKELVDAAGAATASAIISSITQLAEKSPAVRRILIAIAGLVFVALNAATTYVTNKVTAPQQRNPPSLTVPQ